MEVSRVRALRGPNLWSHHTSVEAIVSCTPEEESVLALPGFETRLTERFPQIGHLQPAGHDDTVPMAQVLAVAALGLQAQAGCPVTFSRTTATLERGIFQVVVEYTEEAVGRLALELAEKLCEAALRDQPFDLAGALAQLREL
ncbi:MAG TPA: cyanophycin synthetase, partial [Telluria sp.]|nr:cyanophycin synthetase [Telluria sp.]